MANGFKPSVHQWYSRLGNDELFLVVAVDNGTIEIQSFDGDLEELDRDAWRGLDIELAEPPEDWTGPFDNIERDELDDTQPRNGDGHSRLEPQFREEEEEAWREARPTDEPEGEDLGPPAEPYTDDERRRTKKRKTH